MFINKDYVVLCFWVLHGLVLRCLTHNTGVPDSKRTGTTEVFVEEFLGKTPQSTSLVLVKPRKDVNNVSCCRDTT